MRRFAIEKEILKTNSAVVGCDEVGRGSLAGPVVAAAVTFAQPKRAPRWWKFVKDSKVLRPHQREELAHEIKNGAQGWGIGVVEQGIIDAINIHRASLLAMQQAVDQVCSGFVQSDLYILIDGRFIIPNVLFAQRAIVKGDSKVHSIAAASIIAKVHRDALMVALHETYPDYGFDAHKGYATRQHRKAIKLRGLSSMHRISFCGKIV